MKTLKYLLLLTICLNLCFAGAIYYLLSLRTGRALDREIDGRINAQNGPGKSSGRPQAFEWFQIESTDYRTYIVNLRAIGCPEETIRDLVMTELNKLYAAKSAALRAKSCLNYWQSERPGTVPSYDRERNLFQEKRAVVKELLGIDIQLENQNEDPQLKEAQQRLGFLPQAKREAYFALTQKYSDLEHQVYANSHGLTTADDQAALAALEQQKSTELGSLLTPQEHFELDLRTSPVAERLRRELAGFQPSEAEFRAIYQARIGALAGQSSLDAQTTASDTPPVQQQDPGALLQAALGEQRYAEYQRALDPDYQNLLRIADRYGLSSSAADQVLALKQEFEDEKSQVVNNAQLAADQKTSSLQTLQEQASAALTGVLGQKGFDIYHDRGGAWLERLGK